MEKKEGFLQRIEALELLKKQKKLMREAYQNKIPSMEELNKFLKGRNINILGGGTKKNFCPPAV